MARVLVVEDDQDILNLIRVRLQKVGHRVAAVAHPDDALRLAASDPPDLAILDVGLPGMTGLDLLQELHQRDGLTDLPAIFLSARVQEEDIAAGRQLGAVYLTKPFVATALMRAVDNVLTKIAEERSSPGSSDPYK